ncbi:Ferrochelatase, protoheme ferro-lyase [Pseudoalteromonas sp. SW0106-04]|uniref:ferrochelatase n=1 Tax=Pseudoalteromonas sp. SW0106-04 TaxID=1702169 RepID=UPI0006B477B6|nr:ferrochelatase [Pseudoalteromonas sp. SW0106-04]GAP76576.1 Ferrochelatase, protoheme ferro-lyase [Pseudoalteromonas sp. SW0106-04]
MSLALSQSASRYGVLLVNLGTPDAPTSKAVRVYLREFLSDTRVVEIPPAVWFFILNGIILPIRSPKVAKAYASIWQEQGSPLRAITEQQSIALRQHLEQGTGEAIHVDYAMTYGNPSIASRIKDMQARGIDKIAVLPLYPQYSATTTAAVFDKLMAHLKTVRNLPEIRFLKHYYEKPSYINALAQSIADYRAQHGEADKLIFSFHGIPKRCVKKGDPYFEHCQATAQNTATKLGLSDEQWMMTFQSRFGAEEWLKPYTDETLEALPEQGVKTVQVVCPAFAADCLETLEEISVENAEVFKEAGGESLDYIPALNDSEVHIALLAELAQQQLQNW